MLLKLLNCFAGLSLPHAHLNKKKKKAYLQPAPLLEQKARELLQPYAPTLASKVTVYWNQRLKTTAGLALYANWEINLNPAVAAISRADVERILRHELAHLLAYHRSGRRKIAPHGKEWREACLHLGIPKEKATHRLPLKRQVQRRNFFYCCPSCQGILARVHAPRRAIACLKCCRQYAQGKYDQRFRYELTQ